MIGVHIGGKGLTCAAIDLSDKSIVPGSLVEGRVDKDSGNRHIIPLWSMKIKKALSAVPEDQLTGIGFAIPGPFDYVNGIGDYRGVPKYEQLRDCNITEELLKRLALKKTIEIRYVNDAIGFAIGQEWGSPLTGKKGLSIIIDEGFGSGFLADQLPVLSGSEIPPKGAVYLIPFEDGIADDHFSIRGLAKSYTDRGNAMSLSAQSLILNAHKSPQWTEIFKEFGKKLGTFLVPVLRNFKPEYISFGGVIGSQLSLFKGSMEQSLLAAGIRVSLVQPAAGDHAFLYGGARLFEEPYWKRIQPLLSAMD